MKYVDEFRDGAKARVLEREMRALMPRLPSVPGRKLQIMEVCGGHTHAIFRYGIEAMLPEGVELVHGPGCPVCVLPMGRIDDCIAIAERPNVIFTTFGDAMRVPGSKKSLLGAKGEGADIRMVYSPLDALALARKHPDKDVVFFALGFETKPKPRASRTSRSSAITSRSCRRCARSSNRATCRSMASSGPAT